MEDYKHVRIGIVGAGRAGGSMARALRWAGYTITGIWSRTFERAQTLANDVGGTATATPAEAATAADLVLLAIVDDQITPVAARIAADLPEAAMTMFVHLSGASGSNVLYPLTEKGLHCGAFHPLQTFPDNRSPVMTGAHFAIEANEPLRHHLAIMAERLDGVPLYLDPADRALYHTSATFTANFTVTLLSQAAELLAACGVPAEERLPALLPLLRGTVASLERLGVPAALTGPIVRGDVGTIERHLHTLGERVPHVLPTYRALGEATSNLAAARGTDEAALARIRNLLADS